MRGRRAVDSVDSTLAKPGRRCIVKITVRWIRVEDFEAKFFLHDL